MNKKYSARAIYNDKFKIGSLDDTASLTKLMKSSGMSICDNMDRTMVATLDSPYDPELHNKIFDKCISKWLKGIPLECNIKHAYNILPLGNSDVLIRV